MLHLSPESGKWLPCLAGDDGKCDFLYHAPVGRGEVADSLLWEAYASEELYREPDGVDDYKTKFWFNGEKQICREYDLPAIEYASGRKEWWVDGKLHRTDGPAIEWADGTKEWYQEGGLHRVGGPASEWTNGSKEWWVDGKRHRVDGPAYEDTDGRKEWWVDGKRHRVDGPAYEDTDGRKEWWVDDEEFDESTFREIFSEK